MSGGVGAGFAGGVAGGTLVGALSTKSGRKAAKSVAQIGGLAAVGALAWNAYKKYQGDNGVQADLPTETVLLSPEPVAVWQELPQAQFDRLAENPSSSIIFVGGG